jgi:hypothetical protein
MTWQEGLRTGRGSGWEVALGCVVESQTAPNLGVEEQQGATETSTTTCPRPGNRLRCSARHQHVRPPELRGPHDSHVWTSVLTSAEASVRSPSSQ